MTDNSILITFLKKKFLFHLPGEIYTINSHLVVSIEKSLLPKSSFYSSFLSLYSTYYCENVVAQIYYHLGNNNIYFKLFLKIDFNYPLCIVYIARPGKYALRGKNKIH